MKGIALLQNRVTWLANTNKVVLTLNQFILNRCYSNLKTRTKFFCAQWSQVVNWRQKSFCRRKKICQNYPLLRKRKKVIPLELRSFINSSSVLINEKRERRNYDPFPSKKSSYLSRQSPWGPGLSLVGREAVNWNQGCLQQWRGFSENLG